MVTMLGTNLRLLSHVFSECSLVNVLAEIGITN